MIDFIFITILLVYALLIFAFIIKEYIISLIASIGILITGIYLIIYGVGDITNFLTTSFGIINIGLGAYVLIVGSTQKIEEWM